MDPCLQPLVNPYASGAGTALPGDTVLADSRLGAGVPHGARSDESMVDALYFVFKYETIVYITSVPTFAGDCLIRC